MTPPASQVAVRHDKQTQTAAEAKKEKAIFVRRVIRIIDQASALIEEHRQSVFERYAVLAEIGCGFARIPLEAETHAHIVCTAYAYRNRYLRAG